MKFEDALKAMREGAKIRHPYFVDDVYFQACRVGMMFDETPIQDQPISIVKMRGDYQHEDMGRGNIDDLVYPGTLMIKEKYLEKPCKHGHAPQLNLFLVMSDDWEIYNGS
jgi:hypothetical protein